MSPFPMNQKHPYKWLRIFILEEVFVDYIQDLVITLVHSALAGEHGVMVGRDAVGTGIYFGSYESSKYLLSGLPLPGSVTYALSGAVCGIIAWCVVFPIDTAKVSSPHISQLNGRVLFNEIF